MIHNPFEHTNTKKGFMIPKDSQKEHENHPK